VVYRNFDDSQWQNKVEELEKRIRDLEEENERLRRGPEKRTPHDTPLNPFIPVNQTQKEAQETFKRAMERNPEFFMSVKEKRALREERGKIAESMGLTLRQYGILTKKGPK
jgi:DNA repair exonuclease SbcCD ATPase subunit